MITLKIFHKNSFYNLNFIRLRHEWIAPVGYDTGIKVYSRLKNEKVPLIFSNKNFIKWFICGPTVYDVSHIGHARFDIIRRILEQFFNVKPVVAIGITDIDDKIISKSFDQNINFKSLAKNYELKFFKNLNELNILPFSVALRVSDHIPEIIEFISKLIEKGHAYVIEDGNVYFNNVSKNNHKLNTTYTKHDFLLSGKKSVLDFALWKTSKLNEPYWESPWGRGRPGWHIECSAMASKIFGNNIDIHSGGIDLIFPHHENEEIQSCSYHNCDQWVNYWIHAGELQLNHQKMSKSLNNFISITDFLNTYSPDNLRMFCFISSYRKGLHYCTDALRIAEDACSLILRFLGNAKSYVKGSCEKGNINEALLFQELQKTEENIIKFLLDDFDTAKCYVSLMTLIKITLKMLNEENTLVSSRSPGAIAAVSNFIEKVFNNFGFKLNSNNFNGELEDHNRLEYILDTATKFRDDIRKEALSYENKLQQQNLLQACDWFRNELYVAGISIQDQKNSTSSWTIHNSKKKKEKNNSFT